MTNPSRTKFASIQYLRAIAALIVIAHHARNPRPWLFNPVPDLVIGQAGVDIFFVISGFIMYASARNEPPGEFAYRRIVRVVPLYWIATFATVLVIGDIPIWQWNAAMVEAVVQSLLFIPHYNLEHPGQIWPVLIPGWTLNFEMFFYLLFAVGIVMRRLVPVIFGTIVLLVVAGIAFPSRNPTLATYTDPLLLEFLAGVLVARHRDWLSRPSVMLALPVGVAALMASSLFDGPRVLLWGVPAVAIVTGLLAVEANGRLPSVPLLSRLGDASYSIYLFQIIVVAGMGRVIRLLPVTGALQFAGMMAGCLVGAVVLGWMAHVAIERPIHRYLARRRARGRHEPRTTQAAVSVLPR